MKRNLAGREGWGEGARGGGGDRERERTQNVRGRERGGRGGEGGGEEREGEREREIIFIVPVQVYKEICLINVYWDNTYL